MAKIYNLTVSSYFNFIDYYTNLDSRFVKVSDDTLLVDNKFSLSITWTTYTIITITVKIGDTQIYTGSNNGTTRALSIISEDFIYLRFNRFTTSYNDRYVAVAYAHDDSDNYFVGALQTSLPTNIYNIDFHHISDLTSGYYLANMINFSLPAGSIAYSSIAPLANDGGLVCYCKDLFSCSTVTVDSTVSLPNRSNYYTIGTHTMVKID